MKIMIGDRYKYQIKLSQNHKIDYVYRRQQYVSTTRIK